MKTIDVKRYIVLERKGHGSDGVVRATGFITCAVCGMSPLNRKQLAIEIGVPVNALSRFLNRDTIRADVAATIRASVARVVE